MFGNRAVRASALAIGLTSGLVALGTVGPAAASLGSPSMVLSNNQVSAASTYTAIFTTGTVSVTDLVLVLPAGVAGVGSATVAVSTASSCTGAFSVLTGTSALAATSNPTLGISLTTAIATLGTCVKVVVSGLTNPSSTGTVNACLGDGIALLSNVTAANLQNLTCSAGSIGGSLLNLVTDSASVALTYVAQALEGTTTNLAVAPTLTVLLNGGSGGGLQSASITPSAAGVTTGTPIDAINVATNAVNYTIEAQIAGTSSSLSRMGGSGAGHDLVALSWTTSTCASGAPFNTVASGTYSVVSSALSGLTNGTTTSVAYCWNVDLSHPAGLYTATVNYLVVPSF